MLMVMMGIAVMAVVAILFMGATAGEGTLESQLAGFNEETGWNGSAADAGSSKNRAA